MKKASLFTLIFLAGTPLFAASRFFFNFGIGAPAPVVAYAPPPPPVVGYYAPAPRPGFVWVDGYWTGPRHAWVPGRWVRRPYPRAYWAGPRYYRGGDYRGYWR